MKQLKISDFRNLRNFEDIPEMFGIDGQVLSRPPKRQILTVVLQNFKKSAIKHSVEKRKTQITFLGGFVYDTLAKVAELRASGDIHRSEKLGWSAGDIEALVS